jgi:hypothetical protein
MTYLAQVLADNPLHFWRMADGCSYPIHDIGSSPKHLLADSPTNGGYSGIEAGGGSSFASRLSAFGLHDTVAMTSPLSIECWYWRAERNALEGTPMQFFSGGVDRWALYEEGDGTAFFRAHGVFSNPAGALSLQSWHHLVGTYDEVNARLYVDGALVGTVANAGHVTDACQVGLGKRVNDTSFLVGAMAECAVYPTALSGARVAAHFASVSAPPVPVGGPASTVSATTLVLGGAGGSASLQDILNSVRKTY